MRVAMFLASHHEVGWIMPVQNVLKKHVMFGGSESR